MLRSTTMAGDSYSYSWALPLHILMWSVLVVGFVMMLVVFMMN